MMKLICNFYIKHSYKEPGKNNMFQIEFWNNNVLAD